MKAHLTGPHYTAAIFAGLVGNLLFSVGLGIVGATLAFGILASVFGSVFDTFLGPGSGGSPGAGAVLTGFATAVSIAIGIFGLVVIGLGVLFSGLILKAGRVRKPWATTGTALLISALVSIPLFVLWVTIGNNNDGFPVALVAVLGTAVVGVLIWLWMTWAHRGYASEFVGATASAPAVATTLVEPAAVEPAAVDAAPDAPPPAG
jgi:hypothetical protein